PARASGAPDSATASGSADAVYSADGSGVSAAATGADASGASGAAGVESGSSASNASMPVSQISSKLGSPFGSGADSGAGSVPTDDCVAPSPGSLISSVMIVITSWIVRASPASRPARG